MSSALARASARTYNTIHGAAYGYVHQLTQLHKNPIPKHLSTVRQLDRNPMAPGGPRAAEPRHGESERTLARLLRRLLERLLDLLGTTVPHGVLVKSTVMARVIPVIRCYLW